MRIDRKRINPSSEPTVIWAAWILKMHLPISTSTNQMQIWKKIRVKRKYKSSRASEETTVSTVTVIVHLHDTILTVAAFWPIFCAVVVWSKRSLAGEVTLVLQRKLFYRFLKRIRTQRILPHNQRSLPQSFSSTSARRTSAQHLNYK
jgi:hypothetical protein